VGINLHWILVQHDDSDHPVLGRGLHHPPPLQEQPGIGGRGGHTGEHPGQRHQGEGDGHHPN